MSNLWFYENQTPNLEFCTRVKETLYTEKTPFQELAILNTHEFGRTLVLDGAIQTTIRDEFIYHEMITHVPLFTHPEPKEVLVIGGGDGGTIREVLKHKEVEKARLVEIDRRVVELSRQYLPEISCGLDDPRVEILYEDGIKHLKEARDKYDVILVDSPDPVGPAVGLFTREFYQSVYDALKEDGLFVAQTESPFFNQDIIPGIFKNIKSIFPITRMYLAFVPTYPGGIWSFTLGSKDYDPLSTLTQKTPIPTRYYTSRLHRAAFVLPRYVEELLE